MPATLIPSEWKSPKALAVRKGGGEELCRAVMERVAQLRAQRQEWESVWQEIREFVRPSAKDFNQRTSNATTRKERVFDDFPGLALGIMAAGLHSYLTNPSMRWFELTTRRAGRDRDPAAGVWLEAASEIVYDSLHEPEAAFAGNMHEFYMEMGAFGTAVMLVQRTNGRGVVRLRAIPMAECYIAENDDGVVDTVYREFELTIRQAEMMFGELPGNLSGQKDPERKVRLVHAVEPRPGSGPLKWSSVYVLTEGASGNHVLSTGGFREFPYLVARWTKMAGEVYGRSPAMESLQHIRVLNEATRIMLQSSQLQAAPPLLVDDNGVIGKVKLQPWALIMRRFNPGSPGIQPLPLNPQLAVNLDLINRLHDLIGRAFYNDLFNMPGFGNRDRVTAQEVVASRDDRLRQLAPVLGRLETELLNPLIERVYGLLDEERVLPQMPRSLRNERLKVGYLSPAARAMRSASSMRTMGFVQQILPFLQFKPELGDYLDWDGIMQDQALASEISRQRLLPAEEVERMRQARAQQQQQMQALQGAQQAAAAMKDVAAAQEKMPGIGEMLGI